MDCRLRIETLETDVEPAEDPMEILRWSDYIARLADKDSADSSEDLSSLRQQLEQSTQLPVLLNRCVRRCKRSRQCTSPVIVDNTLCRFNVNSYRMQFAANSNSFYYIPGSLRKAKTSLRSVRTFKRAKFSRWLNAWKQANVTMEQERRCADLLMRRHSNATKRAHSPFFYSSIKKSHKRATGKSRPGFHS